MDNATATERHRNSTVPPASAAQYRAHEGPRAARVPPRAPLETPTLEVEPDKDHPSQPRISYNYVHQMDGALTEAQKQRESALLRNRELLIDLANSQGRIRELEMALQAARQQTAVVRPPPPPAPSQLDARFVARWIIGAVVCGFAMCTAMTAFTVWALQAAG